jgi:hypothetical protein
LLVAFQTSVLRLQRAVNEPYWGGSARNCPRRHLILLVIMPVLMIKAAD